jgi:hypothetical protein
MDRNRLRGKRVDRKQTRPPASVVTQFDREGARSVPKSTGRNGRLFLAGQPFAGPLGRRCTSMLTLLTSHQSLVTSHDLKYGPHPV